MYTREDMITAYLWNTPPKPYNAFARPESPREEAERWIESHRSELDGPLDIPVQTLYSAWGTPSLQTIEYIQRRLTALETRLDNV